MKLATDSQMLTSLSEVQDASASVGTSLHINKGFIAAVIANLLWGTSFLASKYTLLSWGPFTASAIRFGFACLFLIIGMVVTGKKIRLPSSAHAWFWICLTAITGFGLLYPLQLAGLKLVSSGLSSAIMLTSPLFVVLVSNLLLKEKLSTNKMIALGLGIIGGVDLLYSGGHLNLREDSGATLGILLTFAAAGALAVSVITTRKLNGSIDPANLTFWSMLIGLIFLSASAVAFERPTIDQAIINAHSQSWIAVFFLALICSALCFFTWNYAISKATPGEIASTMHLKTPTAVLLGSLIANEAITAPLVVGTIVVMTGVWLSQRKVKE